MTIDKAIQLTDGDRPIEGIGDIEVEIINPDAVVMTVDVPDDEDDFYENLVDKIDQSYLETLASELISDFDDDLNSRKDWIQTYVDGLDVLGMTNEERSEPWEGACGVVHPLLTDSLVKFQSEIMKSSFPAAGPVKTVIIGKETQEKKDAATRVADDMNHQLMDVMTEYRPEHERMLWGLGLSGNAFKKVYFDPSLNRQVSKFIPSEDLVVPYGASDIESAERVTHVMRKTKNEMRRLQAAGFYADVDLGEPSSNLDDIEKKIAEKTGFNATVDDRYKILEMHVDLNVEGFESEDGVARPYIVTIEKGSSTILSVRRNWDDGDELFKKKQYFVHYNYVPGFGFYSFGLIHLIGGFAKSATSITRQLVDAGTLSNLPAGFKSRGLKIKGDDTPISPGEFRDVDVPSGSIRDNLIPLPYKEPSQTLMALRQAIIDEGRQSANTADLQIADMSGQTPVGTTLAILERTLKSMSAIQSRIHYSMKQELVLLKQVISDCAPDDYPYDPVDGDRKAKKSDYKNVNVIPVSDPNASTMAQKIVQYQAVLQLAQTAPQLYDMKHLHKDMLTVLGVKNINKLIPSDDDLKPIDPVTENQNILSMKPVKAFSYQDHKSHIVVHMSAMQDPKIQQLLQGNPNAQAVMASAQAHLAEHLGFEYRVQIEEQLGMALPPQTDGEGEDYAMDKEIEARLAPLLAQAAQQLLANNQSAMAQQQAQKQAQDPVLQLQAAEAQLKHQDLQRKTTKDQSDAQMELKRLDIEREKIALRKFEIESGLKVDSLTAAAKIQAQKDIEGKKLQVDAIIAGAEIESANKRHDLTTKVNSLTTAAQIHNVNKQNEMDRLAEKEARLAETFGKKNEGKEKG